MYCAINVQDAFSSLKYDAEPSTVNVLNVLIKIEDAYLLRIKRHSSPPLSSVIFSPRVASYSYLVARDKNKGDDRSSQPFPPSPELVKIRQHELRPP